MTIPKHDDPELVTHEREPTDDPGIRHDRTALATFMLHIAGKSRLHRTQPINERETRHA